MLKISTALVTGATSGIGEALCHLLADEHINLIISGRNQDQLNQLSDTLSKKVHVDAIVADLTSPEDREKLVLAIQRQCPELVINSAGFGLYGEVIDHETDAQLEMVKVNCSALLQLTVEAAKSMRACQKRGTILNVSSAASLFPFPCFSLYSASKAFVNQLSVSLDEELKHTGIRVLTACPGMVRTQFRNRAAKKKTNSSSKHSMDVKEAAEHILWQIKKGKQLYVFNWKYRWSIRLSRLMPRRLLMRQLRQSIEAIG